MWRRLSARWLARSAGAEISAWRRVDARSAWNSARAVRLFATGLLRGHPFRPDPRTTRLVQTFVTGVDTEGRRDAVTAAAAAP